MLKLVYKDETGTYEITEVLTNHSMSIDDILQLADIDMDAWADDKGWEGWDYDCLQMITTDVDHASAALFDGGWRKKDKKELIQEYDLSEAEAEEIISKLADFERED